MAPDGGVHQLFTVVGRSDIGINGCTDDALPPTDFESEFRRSNTRFRIPLKLFGLGIIDGIQDKEIIERHAATTDIRKKLGIIGIPNRSGNDGTMTRFGWKAQNKSIAMFAGEAYNVEMGVTTDLFPQATVQDWNGLIKQDTSKDSFIMSTEVSMSNQTKQKRPNYTIEFK